MHYIHEKAPDPDAIPLMLNHGWPGSFLEFLPVIHDLTQTAKTSTNKSVSFHAVVPSLPGFTFSSPPPANWTLDDTARVYNTLMTEVLAYKKLAVFGTDFGASPSYQLYDAYNTPTRAAHFAFVPFLPLASDQLPANSITLSSELEKSEQANLDNYFLTGSAYLSEQNTKVVHH
jgi:pimeloyl-ACP methyl ester carboxylesterase